MITYKLYLIRHGMTDGNRDKRFIGRTDLPLSEDGKEELFRLKEEREYPDVQKVYSSPMKRCLETADILYPDRLVQPVDALREYDFGVFEGQTAQDLAGTEMFVQWNEHGMASPPDGGESMTDFASRVASGFDEIINDMMANHVRTAAAVLHGGVILNLLSAFAYPRRDPMLWMTDSGMGYTALINAQLWQRDQVFEVFSKVPFERKPSSDEVDWEEEDDERFFAEYPKDYVAVEAGEVLKKERNTPETLKY